MQIHLALHHGLCFGVRDALRAAHDAAARETVTVLGQLVHNSAVDRHFQILGIQRGNLDDLTSAPTRRVVITAHGAAESDRAAWRQAGHEITDTTCPLVRKAHDALALLVQEGYHPVVIGTPNHTEVRGLVRDYPQAHVLEDVAGVEALPSLPRLGVISQTTQPLRHALTMVDAIKRRLSASEVRFIDTICCPTKQRQSALEDLCARCEVVIVVGGRNSNNTRQLTSRASELGARVFQIEGADEIQSGWFGGVGHVGVTAGTSTLDETVTAVRERLNRIANGDHD